MDAYFFERNARISLKSQQNDFNGIVSASSIEKKGGLYLALIATVAYYYREGDISVRNRIEMLLEEAEYFKNRKLSDDPLLANRIFSDIRQLRLEKFNDDNGFKLD